MSRATRWATEVLSDRLMLGELATQLTCREADALAMILLDAGHDDAASHLLHTHGDGDSDLEADDPGHLAMPEEWDTESTMAELEDRVHERVRTGA